MCMSERTSGPETSGAGTHPSTGTPKAAQGSLANRLPGAFLPAAEAAVIPPLLSYSLLPWRQHAAEGIRLLARYGWTYCEASEGTILGDAGQHFADELARNEVAVSAVYAFLACSSPGREREMYWHHSRIAAEMRRSGYRSVILGPADVLRGAPQEEDLRRFVRITGETAARYRDAGIRVAVHPHLGSPLFLSGSIERAMEELAEDIGLVPDCGQLAEAGIPPASLIRRFGPRIHAIHLKDAAWITAEGGEPLPGGRRRTRPADLGCGSLNADDLLAELSAAGYTDGITVEDERWGRPPEEGLRANTRFLESRGFLPKSRPVEEL